MSTDSPLLKALQIRNRYRITGRLVFETGWRIGSGEEGETMSDLGVVLDAAGLPILAGSSLKGKLRSTCESLAHALGLEACMLNNAVSGLRCPSDVKAFTRRNEEREDKKSDYDLYQDVIKKGPQAQVAWIEENTCDACKLFGSPLRAARLRCADGKLDEATKPIVQVRDGVVLDRDSHKAVDGLKYDYEVVSAGTAFALVFDLDNPTDADLALLGAGLFEWAAGSSLGGFTSRGLGRFRLEGVAVRGVDMSDAKQRLRYLTKTRPEDRLSDLGDLASFFAPRIEAQARKE